jgi:hypothetical protein
LVEDEEIEEDLLDEILGDTDEDSDQPQEVDGKPNRKALEDEIAELTRYSQLASSIGIDTKSRSLLKALEVGFTEITKMGANRKALVFTESRRIQDYLKNFLEPVPRPILPKPADRPEAGPNGYASCRGCWRPHETRRQGACEGSRPSDAAAAWEVQTCVLVSGNRTPPRIAFARRRWDET